MPRPPRPRLLHHPHPPPSPPSTLSQQKAVNTDNGTGQLSPARLHRPIPTARTHFLVQAKRPLHHHLRDLILLLAFDLGVLGVLGASLFPRPEMGSRQGRQARQGLKYKETGPLSPQGLWVASSSSLAHHRRHSISRPWSPSRRPGKRPNSGSQ